MEDLLITLVRNQMAHLEHVSMDNPLIDLGYESFSFVELVVAIEEEFGIEFEDEDLNFRRFDDLHAVAAYVEACVASREKTATGA